MNDNIIKTEEQKQAEAVAQANSEMGVHHISEKAPQAQQPPLGPVALPDGGLQFPDGTVIYPKQPPDLLPESIANRRVGLFAMADAQTIHGAGYGMPVRGLILIIKNLMLSVAVVPQNPDREEVMLVVQALQQFAIHQAGVPAEYFRYHATCLQCPHIQEAVPCAQCPEQLQFAEAINAHAATIWMPPQKVVAPQGIPPDVLKVLERNPVEGPPPPTSIGGDGGSKPRARPRIKGRKKR